jgi:hypothetical protein
LKNKILFWVDPVYTQFGIAKFLQEKLDADFDFIYEVNHHIKKQFINQKYVNFTNQWFYWDHYSKNASKNPDTEYLKSFEEKYDIDLWKIASSERLFSEYNKFHKFTREEILSILEHDCKFFEKVLEQSKPDFLIMKLADFARNQLLLELCVSKGIDVLMLIQSRLGYRMYISSTISESDDFSKEKITDDSKKSFSELREYLKKYDKLKQSKEITNVGLNSSIKNKLVTFLKWSFKTFDNEYRKTYDHAGVTRFSVIKNVFLSKILVWSRTNFLKKNSIKNLNYDEKFIYFPLHVQPERNLDLDAPFYSNQLNVIENIVKSLPVGLKLYVKEHYNMRFRNWRSISFYKSLLNLPNVKLIHPTVNPVDLIKNCSLVISIAGSTALEAAFYEKPSIILANTSFSNLSSVQKLETFEDLYSTIINSLKIKVNLSELNNFVIHQEKNSFNFDEVELNNAIMENFHHNGLVPDSEISINELNSFFESRRSSFEPVITEYINRIHEINRKKNRD